MMLSRCPATTLDGRHCTLHEGHCGYHVPADAKHRALDDLSPAPASEAPPATPHEAIRQMAADAQRDGLYEQPSTCATCGCPVPQRGCPDCGNPAQPPAEAGTILTPEQCAHCDEASGVRCAFTSGHGGNHSWLWCMAAGGRVRFEQPESELACCRRSGHEGAHRITIVPWYRRPESEPPAEPPTHELKTWPEYFAAVASGRKTFEARKDYGSRAATAVSDLSNLAAKLESAIGEVSCVDAGAALVREASKIISTAFDIELEPRLSRDEAEQKLLRGRRSLSTSEIETLDALYGPRATPQIQEQG